VARRFLDDQPNKAFLYGQIRDLNPPHKSQDGERFSTQQLSDTKVPKFMITGEEDYRFPPEVTSIFKEKLPDAQFLTIPESGHSPYFEKPDIFNEAVMKFISKIEDQG
jgi:3-oxoadipate enol-lactonase